MTDVWPSANLGPGADWGRRIQREVTDTIGNVSRLTQSTNNSFSQVNSALRLLGYQIPIAKGDSRSYTLNGPIDNTVGTTVWLDPATSNMSDLSFTVANTVSARSAIVSFGCGANYWGGQTGVIIPYIGLEVNNFTEGIISTPVFGAGSTSRAFLQQLIPLNRQFDGTTNFKLKLGYYSADATQDIAFSTWYNPFLTIQYVL